MVRVLLVSDGAVPTPEHPSVHGGGMRVWGLARALAHHGHDVTVARKPAHTDGRKTQSGVRFTTWSLNAAFVSQLHAYDAVVVSYALADAAGWIGHRISLDTLLILDAYVPIHLEVAARTGPHQAADYAGFGRIATTWRDNLARGDAILCASHSQHAYYTGILASLGVINPWTYRDDPILVVPFGAEMPQRTENPYAAMGLADGVFTLVWFGAIYPWLDIEPVLRTVELLALPVEKLRLVVIGARNPLVANATFDDAAKQAERRISSATTPVISIDWVSYDERLAYLHHAAAVISINTAGRENEFSWRTRLMDSVSAGTPLLTNGGDPLAEMLIEKGAALRIPSDPSVMRDELAALVSDPQRLEACRAGAEAAREELQWEVLVEPLHRFLASGRRPRREERDFAHSHGVPYRGDSLLSRRRIRLTTRAMAESTASAARARLDRFRRPGG